LDSLAVKIIIGSRIAVVDFSENSISGRLLRIDLSQSTLTVCRSVVGKYSDITVAHTGLKEIKFYRNRVRPMYCIAGVAVGGLIGNLFEESRSSGAYFSAGDWFEDHYAGIVIGALAVGGIAAIISFMVPSEGIINCGY